MDMTLQELLEGWADGVQPVQVTGVGLDNRSLEPGEAFVAVQGSLGHGLDYASAAVDAGAVAVIHDGLQLVPELRVPAIEVSGPGNCWVDR